MGSFEEDLFNYQMNDMLDISINEARIIGRIKDNHCLDKQRVREAIKKLEEEYYKFGDPEGVEPSLILFEVLKVLGLEDE